MDLGLDLGFDSVIVPDGVALPASLIFDLSSTNINSYSGSGQVFAELNGTTAFDMNRGATSSADTDDPTFAGTAGTSDGRWTLDGGDFFSLVGVNPDFFKGLHKTSGTGSGPWWIAMTFQNGDVTSFPGLWGTFQTATTNGIEVIGLSATSIRFNIYRDNPVNVANDFTIPSYSNGDDICAIFTGDFTDTDDIKLYWNNTTPIVDTDASGDTSSTDPTGDMILGAARVGSLFEMPSGSEIYDFLGGNEFISNSQAADIFSVLGARRGVDYLA